MRKQTELRAAEEREEVNLKKREHYRQKREEDRKAKPSASSMASGSERDLGEIEGPGGSVL